MPAYMILTGCDHGAAYADIDQIVETPELAMAEAADLLAMGCGQVRIYEFIDYRAADTYAENETGRWPSKVVARRYQTLNPRD